MDRLLKDHTSLQSGKVVLFSGSIDELHQAGVILMLSKRAEMSLIEWKSINERLMCARIYISTLK